MSGEFVWKIVCGTLIVVVAMMLIDDQTKAIAVGMIASFLWNTRDVK